MILCHVILGGPHAAHHRRSIRLPDYDYSTPGAYFVTVCTHDRECLFGEVADGGMVLNEYGKIVASCLQRIPTHFKHIQLDKYVVMPNHVHVILHIVGAKPWASPEYGRCVVVPGEAGQPFASPLPNGTVSGSLGAVMQNFKSVSTRHINTLSHTPGLPVWQCNYYEHVIRDERDLTAIRGYMANNPARWLLDENHAGEGSVDR